MGMDQGKVLTSVDGRVLRITINRPEQRNAIDPETNRLMHEAFERFAADPDLWIAVVRGAGDVAFSAGGDLKAIDSSLSGGPAYAIPETGYGGLTSRFDLVKPVIAAVNGLAFGGGFEIALAADLIVAADHAQFALPEPRAGVFASAGGIHRVVRQLPKKVGMEFLLTGHRMGARRALELGLVNEVVPLAELDAAVDRMVERVLQSAPLSIRATKQMAEMGLALPLEEAILNQEKGYYPALALIGGSNDVREGLRAFAEKRPPVWTAT
jgi:enoyl-CoA hydratase/carnithine racemase